MFGDTPTTTQNKLNKKKSIKYKIQKIKNMKIWKPLQKNTNKKLLKNK